MGVLNQKLHTAVRDMIDSYDDGDAVPPLLKAGFAKHCGRIDASVGWKVQFAVLQGRLGIQIRAGFASGLRAWR